MTTSTVALLMFVGVLCCGTIATYVIHLAHEDLIKQHTKTTTINRFPPEDIQ